MPRIDLLALTHQDLEMLSNRGTVKRSQRELDEAEVQFELTEDAGGNVTVTWSEGVTTKLPSDKVLRDCPCSCPAVGICRHIVRAVLAYQIQKQSSNKDAQLLAETKNSPLVSAESPVVSAVSVPEKPPLSEARACQPRLDEPTIYEGTNESSEFELKVWDPGSISDEELEKTLGSAQFGRVERLFKERHIVELVRGIKPFAKFHTLAHSIRFLVPFDLRYVHCDCTSPAPCIHLGLAAMAFRKLPVDETAGTIVTAPSIIVCNQELISTMKNILFKVTACGIAHINASLVGELKRAADTCAENELIWPADMLGGIVLEIERYQERDARYSAGQAMKLLAELFIRFAAMNGDSVHAPIPIEFVKGMHSDQPTEVASTRLVGLGCGGSISRFGSSLVAYMQDLNNGNLITMKKEFVEKVDEEWRPLYALAEKPALKAIGLGALGKGQILTKGGKLTRSREYLPGRCQFTFNPQSFQWELLRPPLLVETFAELKAVLASRFPAYLAPRYSGRDFYVCHVKQAVDTKFNEMEQTIESVLLDRDGQAARLYLPYYSVSSQGCEVLLHNLTKAPEAVRFVAGHVHSGREGLVLNAVALIFEEGNRRTMIQPWVDRSVSEKDQVDSSIEDSVKTSRHSQYFDPLSEYLGRVLDELGALLTNGFERIDSRSTNLWQQLAQEAESIGFSYIAEAVSELSDLLASKASKLNWNAEHAAHVGVDLAILLLVAQNETVQGDTSA